MCASARSALSESGITITSVTSVLALVDSMLNWSMSTVNFDGTTNHLTKAETAGSLVIGQVATRGRSITPIFFEIRFKEEMKMNRFESVKNPLMWSMTLLLTALVVGCGGQDPILGGGGAGTVTVTTGPAITPANLLGLAAPFGIASTAGITNTLTAPITVIHGDVILVNPSPSCNGTTAFGGIGSSGFDPFGAPGTSCTPTFASTPVLDPGARVVTPTYPDVNITAAAVKADMNTGYLSITPPAGPPAAGSLGGATNLPAGTTLGAASGSALVQGDNLFYPGVYQSITTIMITGDLTLDAQGNPNAVFVFQSSGTVGTSDGASGGPGTHTRILLTGGAKASNVWWQAGSSATLGLYSEFNGNILAAMDITMKTGATSCGRLMSGAWVGGSGALVFDSNVVSVPGNVYAPPSCQ